QIFQAAIRFFEDKGSKYLNLSDDGNIFCSGFEKVFLNASFGTVYEANLRMTERASEKIVGEMNCRLTFTKGGYGAEDSVKLLSSHAHDSESAENLGYDS
ncbi:MAG: hypothetical protein LBC41_18055, partial [Clostridiales bacterium]|nr:hypothetical protein [Clostridiales bacterium]